MTKWWWGGGEGGVRLLPARRPAVEEAKSAACAARVDKIEAAQKQVRAAARGSVLRGQQNKRTRRKYSALPCMRKTHMGECHVMVLRGVGMVVRNKSEK